MILPYWKLETFNDKLNVNIAFIKSYWKPLLRANLLIAGPPFIIGIGAILFFSNIVANDLIANPEDPNWLSILGLIGSIIFGSFFYGFAILSIAMVTMEVIKVQNERPEKLNDLKFILNNCRKRLKKMIGFMLISIVAYTLVSSIMNVFIFPAMFAGPWGALILIPAYFIGYTLVFSYIYVIVPTAYYEKISTSKTLKKGIELVKNKFWQTAGMFAGNKIIQTIIISGIVVPILSGLFGYFAYKEKFGGGVNLFTPEGQQYLIYLIMIFTFFYLALNLFSNIFHIISGAIQYYCLKEEKENPYVFHNIEHFEDLGLNE